MERHKGGRGRALAFAAVAILAIPLIYVLSSGPADVLRQRGFISVPNFIAFYSPLGWLSRHCPPFASFLEWYVGLFR